MPRLEPDALTAAIARVLSGAGTPESTAVQVAEWVVTADLSGHPSHGVMSVPAYIGQISAGTIRPAERPEIRHERGAVIVVDGHDGFGHVTAHFLVSVLAERARAYGVATGAAVRCQHIGRLGQWAEQAAEAGVLLLMVAGGTGSNWIVVPHGGAEPNLHTNPIAFVAPGADVDPIVLDIATSAVAGGKVAAAAARGESIPEGWIVDRHGNPTTDPNDLDDGGAQLPAAGHKGYGLAILAEVLAANLTGVAPSKDPRGGVFAVAIDPNAFGEADRYFGSTSATIQRLRSTRPARPDGEVLIPGDAERRSRAELRAFGVDVPETTWTSILDAAAGLGLEPAEVNALAGA